MNRKQDLLNRQFGKLKVLKYGNNNNWICKCDCGYSGNIVVRRIDLLNNVITDCGCVTYDSIQNKKFGKLKVRKLDRVVNRVRCWSCDCDCGNTNIIVPENVLVNYQRLTCGHCRHVNLANKRFEDLTVIKAVFKDRWLCKCSCKSNKEIILPTWALKSGIINNCGCKPNKAEYSENNLYKHIEGNTTIIYAANTGTEFCIDTEDFNKVRSDRWVEAQGGYLWTRKSDGSQTNLQCRVLGLKSSKGIEIIHKDNDRKNARKGNLAIANDDNNINHRGLRSNNKTGQTGVSLYGKYNYRAQIMVNGVNRVLGVRSNMDDAIELRKKAEETYFKDRSDKQGV